MVHVSMLVHANLENFPRFERWVNNYLNYGSKPYLREVKLYDVSIREENLEPFLSDLKNHYKEVTTAGTFLGKLMNYVRKLLKLKPIDMNKITRSGKKMPGEKGGLYIYPLGVLPDRKTEQGGEEI